MLDMLSVFVTMGEGWYRTVTKLEGDLAKGMIDLYKDRILPWLYAVSVDGESFTLNTFFGSVDFTWHQDKLLPSAILC